MVTAACKLFATLVLLTASLAAQNLQAQATFPFTGSPALIVVFQLNDFDTHNLGTGTITKIGADTVNLPVSWARNADGDVTISIDGVLASQLIKAPQNSQGGDALLNSQTPQTGSWQRQQGQ